MDPRTTVHSLRGLARPLAIATLVALATSGCEEVERLVDARRDMTPHERYHEGLRDAGLAETALGREWSSAARLALEAPRVVSLPFREEGFITPEDPAAVGYRFELPRGRVLRYRVDVESTDSARVFVDLFRVPVDGADPFRPVATVDTTADGLTYEPWRSGEYILRLQPELLRGGRYRVVLSVEAALAFPVDGSGTNAVQSFFGAPRDGGVRDHHGVDIFAPRGTPVVAATEGTTYRVNETGRGGRVVWIRDRRRNQSLYYAHLDSQAVAEGQAVAPGDTLGFVGNTGNARSTPPHLHFGLYRRGEGPIDPLPFIRPSLDPLPELTADLAALGAWAKVTGGGVHLRDGPAAGAGVVGELDPGQPLRVVGGAGEWYRVRLADDREGYVAARLTEPADRPRQPLTGS